ncbi:Adenylate cyclase [Diplonema papillatum]|nr:Adenylate cyclase [Diplonema papillatum]
MSRWHGIVSLRSALIILIVLVLTGTVGPVWILSMLRSTEYHRELGHDELRYSGLIVHQQVLHFFSSVSALVETSTQLFGRALRENSTDPFAHVAADPNFFLSAIGESPYLSSVLFASVRPEPYRSQFPDCDVELALFTPPLVAARSRKENFTVWLIHSRELDVVGVRIDPFCGLYGLSTDLWKGHGVGGTPPDPGISVPTWSPVTTYTSTLALKKVLFPLPAEVGGFGAVSVRVASGETTEELFNALLAKAAASSPSGHLTIFVLSNSGELFGTSDPRQGIFIRGADRIPTGVHLANNATAVSQPTASIADGLIREHCTPGLITPYTCTWSESTFDTDEYIVRAYPVVDSHAAGLHFMVVAVLELDHIDDASRELVWKLSVIAAGVAVLSLAVSVVFGRAIVKGASQFGEHLANAAEMRGLDELARDEGGGSWITEASVLRSALSSVAESLTAYGVFLPDALDEDEEVDIRQLQLAASNPLAGSPTAAAAPRGSAAVVFTDLPSAAVNWEQSPRAMRRALVIHNAIVRNCATSFGGYEVKTVADNFMMAFPSMPSAVQFCLTVQEKFFEMAWPKELTALVSCGVSPGWNGPRIRMGAHYGAVDAEFNTLTQRWDYFGQVVNKASRLCGVALDGALAIDQSDLALLAGDTSEYLHFSQGMVNLKGVRGEVNVWHLVPKSLPERSGGLIEISPEDVAKRDSSLSRLSGKTRESIVFPARVRDRSSTQKGKLPTRFTEVACTVAHTLLVPESDVLHKTKAYLEAVVSSAARTAGIVSYVIGTGVGVSWNASSRCSSHLSGGVNFAGLVYDNLGESFTVGIATGPVLAGRLSASTRSFVAVIGFCVSLACELSSAARQLSVVALSASLPKYASVAHDRSLHDLIRPVDRWTVPASAPAVVMTVFQVRVDCLKQWYLMGHDEHTEWAWSDAYRKAFDEHASDAVQAATSDSVALHVSRLLARDEHLRSRLPPGWMGIGREYLSRPSIVSRMSPTRHDAPPKSDIVK